MLSLYLLEDYQDNYSNIPPSKVKMAVVIDIVVGCIFSVIMAIINLLALLITSCMSLVTYQKFSNKSISAMIDSKKKVNTLLDKGFVVNKGLEIGLLLLPVIGFLTLFLLKIYSGITKPSWEKCLFVHENITSMPAEILNARLHPGLWQVFT